MSSASLFEIAALLICHHLLIKQKEKDVLVYELVTLCT